jgi:Retrotransposon gag protein
MSGTNSPPPAPTGIPGLKIPKPDKFNGSDTSLSTVTNWAYNVEEYLELSHVPAETQTKFASLFLDKEAKTWYRNTYANVRPLPALDDFLKAFKEQFLAFHGDDDIIKRLGEIDQGSKTTSQYSTEFQMLIIQLGKTDNRFAKHNYMRGLNY